MTASAVRARLRRSPRAQHVRALLSTLQAATQLQPRDSLAPTMLNDAKKRKLGQTDDSADASHAGTSVEFMAMRCVH